MNELSEYLEIQKTYKVPTLTEVIVKHIDMMNYLSVHHNKKYEHNTQLLQHDAMEIIKAQYQEATR